MTESLRTPEIGEEPFLEPVTTKVTKKPFTIFFTGLPGAGKTTLALETEQRLTEAGYSVRVWDGDEVRATVSADLGFSREDRIENIRRMSKLAADSEEDISIVAAVSPSTEARDVARSVIEPERELVMIYVATPVDVCEERDPKGLYAKARSGEIDNFTGISDPYEAPENRDYAIDTTDLSITESIDRIMDVLREHELLED